MDGGSCDRNTKSLGSQSKFILADICLWVVHTVITLIVKSRILSWGVLSREFTRILCIVSLERFHLNVHVRIYQPGLAADVNSVQSKLLIVKRTLFVYMFVCLKI